MLAALLSVVCAPLALAQMPVQAVDVGVEDATAHGAPADGVFSLVVSTVGRPFAFEPRSLHFSWQAEDAYGDLTATQVPAAIHVGTWMQASLYAPYVDTSANKDLKREYRAPLDFGVPPPRPGLYELVVRADPGFAHTDRGGGLTLGRSTIVDVYWPDERNGDAATADLRRRVLGRDVYAFGGSLVACRAANKPEAFDAPLHVTRVWRHNGAAYWLETGATGHSYPTSFVSIDPIEVNVGNCDPGFRFADPWHAGVSITTQKPPASLRSDATIVPGMSRNAVRWLLGYPDRFGTAQYFNDLDGWLYEWPQSVSEAVSFKNGRVVQYVPPGNPP
ncbi:MAG TPA: hypothetical protein VNF68_04075 [Candidatus Baltobacteraceae bacterium]|nr:hypothetical protein [Candidatus Baltobacteraceae bacterium]